MDGRTAYPHQGDALRTAQGIIRALPLGLRWSLMLTEADLPDAPGVLNIFVDSGAERLRLRAMLRLQSRLDEGDSYESYRLTDTLVLSLIEEPE